MAVHRFPLEEIHDERSDVAHARGAGEGTHDDADGHHHDHDDEGTRPAWGDAPLDVRPGQERA